MKSMIDCSIGQGSTAAASISYTTLHDTLSDTGTDTTGVSTVFSHNGTSFTLPSLVTVIAMRLSMRLWSSDTPPSLVIPEVWSTSSGAPNALITAGTGVDCSDLPSSKPGSVNKVFEVTGLSLSASAMYCFVLNGFDFSGGEVVTMQRVGNEYAGGNHVAKLKSSTWLNITGSDLELLLEYGQ